MLYTHNSKKSYRVYRLSMMIKIRIFAHAHSIELYTNRSSNS